MRKRINATVQKRLGETVRRYLIFHGAKNKKVTIWRIAVIMVSMYYRGGLRRLRFQQ